MTHWNHRILKRVYDNGDIEFGPVEAYYNGYDIVGWTEEFIAPVGESVEELEELLELMMKALERPPLDEAVLLVALESKRLEED